MSLHSGSRSEFHSSEKVPMKSSKTEKMTVFETNFQNSKKKYNAAAP